MARLRARMAAEGGFSLIELVVAMAIFTFVMGAALSLFENTLKSAPKDQERADAIGEARTGISGITRELRDAYDIVELPSTVDPDPEKLSYTNTIDFLVTRQGVYKQVRYQCGLPDTAPLTQCRRKEVTFAGPPAAPPEAPLDMGSPPYTGSTKVIGRMVNGTAADLVFSFKMPRQDELDPGDALVDYPEAVPCVVPPADPLVLGCLPAPWPTSIGVEVSVPVKGEQKASCTDPGAGTRIDCYRRNLSWSDNVYLRNLEAKQSAFNSGS